jgi:adenine-specific DNA methylase
MIERDFDVPFVADLALREKQIQQNYRPIIAVHKWFARRPGTLFRALILSEFGHGAVRDLFYKANTFPGVRIADPFMGGGTPLLEANRVGCDVVGSDINPMAYWIVKEEIEHLDIPGYLEAAKGLRQELQKQVGHLYRTQCLKCGTTQADVKYFLWVKVLRCQECGKDYPLFPGYLLSEDRRHPKNVFVCGLCGELSETESRNNPGDCKACGAHLSLRGPASEGRCPCPHCGAKCRFPNSSRGAPRHQLFAIEYHCSHCKPGHMGRFFKKPDSADLSNYAEAERSLRGLQPEFVPDEAIPSGDETDRLHRWGYSYYREMFNARQLLGLEWSCRLIAQEADQRIRNALATNLSDLLRYQNMLCRYDTMALKSLDIFSVHGFPVGLIECESNLLGIPNGAKGVSIGSGGWSNIVEKFVRAKSYCDSPFEVQHRSGRKVQVQIDGEWIGDERNCGRQTQRRSVAISCQSAIDADLPAASLDAVLTDPPYYGNVQYAELMDFCFVWLRKLVMNRESVFARDSTRDPNELTGNMNMGRGLHHFTEGLSAVFRRMARALKPGSPMAFTYHHNNMEAYLPVAVAILDSGLVCSASLPCPAEMGASIHISRTGSSIVDTIFVCRSKGTVPRSWIVDTAQGISQLVANDIQSLAGGHVTPTQGDVRCIVYGHLVRLAVWFLRKGWVCTAKTEERLEAVRGWMGRVGGLTAVQECLRYHEAPRARERMAVMEEESRYEATDLEVAF